MGAATLRAPMVVVSMTCLGIILSYFSQGSMSSSSSARVVFALTQCFASTCSNSRQSQQDEQPASG